MTHSDRDASERWLNRVTSVQEATGTTPAPQATAAQIKAAQDVLGCYRDMCIHGAMPDGVCPRARNVANRVVAAGVSHATLTKVEALANDPVWASAVPLRDALSAPAGPPLHEQADRDGDNVPSDRRYAEFEVWDSSVPPGGMVCRECGTPVESEPCYQHNRAAREDRYAEAIDPGAFAETQPYPGRDPRPLWRQMAVQTARAVMAVADREQAELRAEIARLTHLLGSHADGHRCTCTMIDPGNFYVGGGNAHPPEWEQDPWCPTHPDVNQIKGELRNLALTWDADADASEDTHPKEARAVLSCARELLAVLRGPEPTEEPS